MNYQILTTNYINTGGNTMVSIFETWLPDENKTVFVNVGNDECTITTVNHLMNDIQINCYQEITVAAADYVQDELKCKYSELMMYCLFEYFKQEGNQGVLQAVRYSWLPEVFKVQITNEQREYTDETFGYFETDGYRVYTSTKDNEQLVLKPERQPKSLKETIQDSLSRLNDKLEIDEVYMDSDDLGQLRVTIDDLKYWLNNLE